MKAASGMVVTMHYTLTNDSGDVLDSSRDSDPMTYLHGHGNIIPGLEKALQGTETGHKSKVTVTATEAYGEKNDELVFEAKRDQFPADMPLALGDHVPQELLFVASLAVVFIISAFAAFFQFSFAIGAFAAGIALSSSSSSHEITGRVRPLKDFFLILFFVGMGLQLGFAGVLGLPLLVLLAAGALLIKPGATFLALKLPWAPLRLQAAETSRGLRSQAQKQRRPKFLCLRKEVPPKLPRS